MEREKELPQRRTSILLLCEAPKPKERREAYSSLFSCQHLKRETSQGKKSLFFPTWLSMIEGRDSTTQKK